MTMYDFSQEVDRTHSLSVKWNKDAIKSICNNPKALPFWVADMDFQAPPTVIDILKTQVEHGVLGYPVFESLSGTFASWARRRHGWNVESNSVITSPGMLASIALLVEIQSNRGDSIILPMPAYQPFVHIIKGLERHVVQWPLSYDRESHRFSLDIPLLEQLAREKHTPVLLFCSPHNPTGRVFTQEELDQVAKIAARYSLTVISDEIHADLSLAGHTHIPFDVVAKRHGVQAVTCMAPSKTFNIAGEHFSVAVCSDDELEKRVKRRMRALHLAPDLLASASAFAAYEGGYEWLEALRIHLAKQVDFITSRLEDSGSRLHFVVPQASFIGFIDCSEVFEAIRADAKANRDLYNPLTSVEGGLASRFFGQRAGIAMNDGTWFGSDYRQFVRFNYGTTLQSVSHAMDAIVTAAGNLS